MELQVTYQITDENLFSEKVVDLDTSGLKCMSNYFEGTFDIELEDGTGWHSITGQFSKNDYVDEYGFKLIPA